MSDLLHLTMLYIFGSSKNGLPLDASGLLLKNAVQTKSTIFHCFIVNDLEGVCLEALDG